MSQKPTSRAVGVWMIVLALFVLVKLLDVSSWSWWWTALPVAMILVSAFFTVTKRNR